ncbi:hypothetical protein EFK50_10905 [Nocardioides marmoriginsengisoli]|uniref:Uncharacterized protein n=1 Tax=Nocardioides marmoriginsengisoli TaxID=661483 RepID=A0A3N0CFR3_9ACTN|nr:hypothetical protein [Nocardioides marmoriginsengisoli]RNL62285.1 hypothetical protein EFK50_10905 [Nocardioides marmoriginsengisoli]
MIRFVLVLLLLAAALYGVFWAIDRRNSGGAAGPARPLPRGPVGPDDDEAFLRDLDRDARRSRPDPAPKPDPTPDPTSQETHDHPE